jgi:hypothetical protein
VETILSLLGLLVAVAGFILSRTDRLLKEMRDLEREIRDTLLEIRDLERQRDRFSPRTIDYPPPYGKKD